MEKAQIDRINELAKIAKERELTPEEAVEREGLRRAYLESFRKSFRNQLDNTVVQMEDGTKVPLRDAPKRP